jgi:hypothetical protein
MDLLQKYFLATDFTDFHGFFQNHPCEFVKSVAKRLTQPLRYRLMQEV